MVAIAVLPSRTINQILCFLLLLLISTASLAQEQVLLGSTEIHRFMDSDRAGTAEAFHMLASASGQVDQLSLFVDSTNTAATIWVGIYENFNSRPGRLLSDAAILSPLPGRWNSVAIPRVQVIQGKLYWIALLGADAGIKFRDRRADRYCYSLISSQTNLTTLPVAWSSGSTSSSCLVSVFGSGSPSGSISVSLSPATASLQVGQQKQFTASVSGSSNTAVTWSASGGTVSSSGLYTAPSSAGSYTVTAYSVADSSKFASAAITVSTPISVSVSPTSASIPAGTQQLFDAYVSGSSNTAVNWSASGGSISSSGLYTAPSVAGTYTVQAVSVADPTKSASASVGVTVPSISISISPTSTTMPAKWQQQFAATVSGTSYTAVTWAVTKGSGTITSTGLFTAPATGETDWVTATSQADTTKSASATVSVAAPHSVSLTWSASSSSGVSSYNVYRGTSTGGPYTQIKSRVSATAYTDTNVLSGTTYYYVTTAVNAAGAESVYSDEVQAPIPMP